MTTRPSTLLRDLTALAADLAGYAPTPRKVILGHPLNVKHLHERAGVTNPDISRFKLGGIEIRADKNLPRWATRYEPPSHRFVEYCKADEPWLRYFGFGRTVDTTEMVFYEMTMPNLHAPFQFLHRREEAARLVRVIGP